MREQMAIAVNGGKYFSRTTDHNFRCFYPHETYLTYLYQLVRKKKKQQLHVIVMLKLLHHACHISAYSGISGSLFSI